MTELRAALRDRILHAWTDAKFCHWMDCAATDPDVLEEDHIPELVQYAKLMDSVHYFCTSFPYPYKLVKSWRICSLHHSKVTNMRIRGERVIYPEQIQSLIDLVMEAGKKLSEAMRESIREDFRASFDEFRTKDEEDLHP